MISMLTKGAKSYLRRANPLRVAILGFSIGIVSLVIVISYIIDLSPLLVLGSVVPAAGLAVQLYRTALSLQKDPTAEDNERFRELVNMIEELEGDLTDYQRVIRVLENRNVELDSILEQTNASRGIWIAFGDQKLNSVPNGISADDINDGNWVRYILERDYDLVMVTPQSWLIPPAVVEREDLGTADQDRLDQWMEKEVFEKFPSSTATIPLMSVVNLGRSYVKQGVDGAHMDTIPIAIIENAETFTEEDLLQALRKQQFNLLDAVKSGTLVFFLPLDLTDTKVEAIRIAEEIAVQDLSDRSLRGLASNENTTDLANGLRKVDAVDSPERLAEDITAEAQRWNRVISGMP